jgi:hypothetical protein
MPIYIMGNGQYGFRCINHELPSHHTAQGLPIPSMRADARWLSFIGAEPPVQPAPGVQAQPPQLNFGRGQALRAYTCSICGYIEGYDAQLVDPELWGGA